MSLSTSSLSPVAKNGEYFLLTGQPTTLLSRYLAPVIPGLEHCSALYSAVCSTIPAPFFTLFRNRSVPGTVGSFRRCYAETVVYVTHRGSTMQPPLCRSVCAFTFSLSHLSTAPDTWRASPAFKPSYISGTAGLDYLPIILVKTRTFCLLRPYRTVGVRSISDFYGVPGAKMPAQ